MQAARSEMGTRIQSLFTGLERPTSAVGYSLRPSLRGMSRGPAGYRAVVGCSQYRPQLAKHSTSMENYQGLLP